MWCLINRHFFHPARAQLSGADTCQSWPQPLATAASLQTASTHPLAKAVLSAAQHEQLILRARLARQKYYPAWVLRRGRGPAVSTGQQPPDAHPRRGYSVFAGAGPPVGIPGHTVSWLAEVSPRLQLIGLLAFGDTLKPEATGALQQLHALGIHTLLLTGDNQGSADHVAQQLGIQTVIANALPADKAQLITELKAAHHRVGHGGRRN